MMIFMHFTFQSIFLAVGLGVGYWLLVTANTQEDKLKNIGNVLGTLLITVVILLSIISCYYSIKFAEEDYTPVGCEKNMQKMDNEIDRESAESESLQKHKNDSTIDSQNGDEMEDVLPENKGLNVNKDNEDND